MSSDGPTPRGEETGSDPAPSLTAWARHRLAVDHFLELAQGSGGDAAVAVLRAAQLSRRLLLLRALVEAVDRHDAPPGPLPTAQQAWDLLARAEREDRDAVQSVLLHPCVGSWLGQTLRDLRAGSGAAARRPVWGDSGQVHAVAAAAALKAGIRFRAPVPLQDTGVLLPSLGCAVLPGAPSGVAAEVFRDRRGAGVRCPSGTVPLPDDLGQDAPGWWALRRLRPARGDLRCAPLLDSLDPWRHYLRRSPVVRMSDSEAAAWQDMYEAAWHLVVEQSRVDPAGIAGSLLAVTPLPDRSPSELFSGSAPEAYGGVLMSKPHRPVDMAAALVHEAQHTKLSALLDLVTLLHGGLEEHHYAPWRADPRPLRGILHGVYAFLGVASFWQALRERTDISDAERAEADFEFALRRSQVEEGLRTLWAEGSFADLGERFLRGVERTLAALLKEPVPAAAALAADEARDDHRMVFRLSQLHPDTAAIRAWADAAAHRTQPPRRYPTVRPLAGPTAQEVRTRLVRIRFGDPERFALLRGDPQGGAGASASDYAWAAGDRDAALAGYRRRVAENPADPTLWAGLGLSLPEGPARDALLHRPEVVAAVYRELVRQVARQTPESVAAWIAGAAAEAGPGG
ncbi:HEXXH motif domain-containing protein [Streptomyces montanus]|uniref:HEXXH motif domain-containing protein n=1 Tax=Streptomyces montanus TaxID=2580423 RepID=A0A5R9FPS6_9ACTN|nr:HEXXH motif domain-containing protein [Streptomyces montanus]TLS41525.1 HEXXH motif domain-containing protein [Streptomyces montanus]